MRTTVRNARDLIAFWGATVIICTINMDQDRSDLVLH